MGVLLGRRILTILGLFVAGLAIAVVTGWGALVLCYLAPGSETLLSGYAPEYDTATLR